MARGMPFGAGGRKWQFILRLSVCDGDGSGALCFLLTPAFRPEIRVAQIGTRGALLTYGKREIRCLQTEEMPFWHFAVTWSMTEGLLLDLTLQCTLRQKLTVKGLNSKSFFFVLWRTKQSAVFREMAI